MKKGSYFYEETVPLTGPPPEPYGPVEFVANIVPLVT